MKQKVSVTLLLLALLSSAFIGYAATKACGDALGGGLNGDLQFIAPSQTEIYNQTLPVKFLISWSITQPVWFGVSDISYSIDDGEPAVIDGNFSVSFPHSSDVVKNYFSEIADISSLSSGRHSLTVTVKGSAVSSIAIFPFGYTFKPVYFAKNEPVNFSPPTIQFNSPKQTTYNQPDVPLNFTLDQLPSTIRYSVDGARNITIEGNTILTGLADGLHSVTVYVSNGDGDKISKTVNFTIAVPPKITLLSPNNQTYVDSSMKLSFTANKPIDWVGYSLDGKQNVTITGNCPLPNLSEGVHHILVYANGTYGGMGGSEKVDFNVSHFYEYALFAVAAIAVLVVAVLALYYSKRHQKTRR